MKKVNQRDIIKKLLETLGDDSHLFRGPEEDGFYDVPNVPFDKEFQTNIGFPGFTQPQAHSAIEPDGIIEPQGKPERFGKEEPFNPDEKTKEDVSFSSVSTSPPPPQTPRPSSAPPLSIMKLKEPAESWKKPFTGEGKLLEDKYVCPGCNQVVTKTKAMEKNVPEGMVYCDACDKAFKIKELKKVKESATSEDRKVLLEPPANTPKETLPKAKPTKVEPDRPLVTGSDKRKVVMGSGDEVREQGKKATAGMPVDPNAEGPGVNTPPADTKGQMPGEDPNAQTPVDQTAQPMPGADASLAGFGGVPGAFPGMSPEEYTQKSAEEIGRIYEFKKIYARLLAIEEHLATSSDEILLKLKNYVSKVIELFETVISNIEPFKEKIDDIIIIFYKFLESTYAIIRKYYKMKRDEENQEKEETLPAMRISQIIDRYRNRGVKNA